MFFNTLYSLNDVVIMKRTIDSVNVLIIDAKVCNCPLVTNS